MSILEKYLCVYWLLILQKYLFLITNKMKRKQNFYEVDTLRKKKDGNLYFRHIPIDLLIMVLEYLPTKEFFVFVHYFIDVDTFKWKGVYAKKSQPFHIEKFRLLFVQKAKHFNSKYIITDLLSSLYTYLPIEGREHSAAMKFKEFVQFAFHKNGKSKKFLTRRCSICLLPKGKGDKKNFPCSKCQNVKDMIKI
jgi:hypothetical protein